MGFVYTIPTLIFVAVLFLTPLVLAARMSLSSWGLLTGQGDFTFPKNFVAISKNQLFWPAVIFTVEYTVIVTVLLLGMGLGLALLVQTQSRWANFLRTVFLLPVSLGLAAASLLAYGFFSPAIGPIGPAAHEAFGLVARIDPVPRHAAQRVVIDDISDRVEICGLLYARSASSACRAFPDDVFEAAALDGATPRQTFRYVTLPLLRPSLTLALILCVTGSLLAFDQFFILTKGAPNNSTVTVVQVIYREAFQRQNLGTAAALSIIVLAVLLALNAAQFKFLRGSTGN